MPGYGYGTPAPAGPSGPRASFGLRLVAFIVDWIVLVVFNVVATLLLGSAAGTGLSIIAGFAYYGFFEGGPAGQTVGKKAVDIRVVRAADGGALGWGPALLRYLCRIVSSIPCLLGYLWMLWDSEKQTWHDKLSGTVVVPAAAWPPPPGSFGRAPAA